MATVCNVGGAAGSLYAETRSAGPYAPEFGTAASNASSRTSASQRAKPGAAGPHTSADPSGRTAPAKNGCACVRLMDDGTAAAPLSGTTPIDPCPQPDSNTA